MFNNPRVRGFQHLADGVTFMVSKIIITAKSFNLSYYQLCFLNSIFLFFGIIRFLILYQMRDRNFKKRYLFSVLVITSVILLQSLSVVSSFFQEMDFGEYLTHPFDESFEELSDENLESAGSLMNEHESCIVLIMLDFLLVFIPLSTQFMLELFNCILKPPYSSKFKMHNYPGSYRYHVDIMKEIAIYFVLFVKNILVVCINSYLSIPHILSIISLRDSYYSSKKIIASYILKCAIIANVRHSFKSKLLADLDDTKCTICWETLDENLTLPCDHSFHENCLCLWLEKDNSCPICRRKLLDHFNIAEYFSNDLQQQQELENITTNTAMNNTNNRGENSSVNGRQYAMSFRFDICFSFGSNAMRSAEVASWANSYIPLVINFNRFDTNTQDNQTQQPQNQQTSPNSSTPHSSSPPVPPQSPQTTETPTVINLNNNFFGETSSSPDLASRTSSASQRSEDSASEEKIQEPEELLNSPAPSASSSFNVGTDNNTETSTPNQEEERMNHGFTQPQLNRRPLMIQASIGSNQLLNGYTNVGRMQFNIDTARYFRYFPSVYVEMVRQSGSFISLHSNASSTNENSDSGQNNQNASSSSTVNPQTNPSNRLEVLKENLNKVENEIKTLEEENPILTNAKNPNQDRDNNLESNSKKFKLMKTLHTLQMRKAGLKRVISSLESNPIATSNDAS